MNNTTKNKNTEIIKLGNQLGNGSFAKVVAGQFRNKHVVVKIETKGSVLEKEYGIYELLMKDKLYHNYILTAYDFVNEVQKDTQPKAKPPRKMLVLSKATISLDKYLLTQKTTQLVKNKKGVDVRVPYFPVHEFKPFMLASLYCLRFLHTNGIVHQDIKPDNFVLHKKHLKIIDFGLSKKAEARAIPRPYGSFIGSQRYCSVRAYEGQPLSYRDDLESLIYMWAYCLSGWLPWQIQFNQTDYGKEQFVLWRYSPVPELFKELMEYVKTLQYKEMPNYSHLVDMINREMV